MTSTNNRRLTSINGGRASRSAASLKSVPVKRLPKAYAPTGQIGQTVAKAFALQAEIQRLQAQLEPLREQLLTHCQKQKLARIDCEGFQVQRKLRHKWEYSVTTQNEMLRLQQLQKLEQQNGTAMDSPTEYVSLVFKGSQG